LSPAPFVVGSDCDRFGGHGRRQQGQQPPVDSQQVVDGAHGRRGRGRCGSSRRSSVRVLRVVVVGGGGAAARVGVAAATIGIAFRVATARRGRQPVDPSLGVVHAQSELKVVGSQLFQLVDEQRSRTVVIVVTGCRRVVVEFVVPRPSSSAMVRRLLLQQRRRPRYVTGPTTIHERAGLRTLGARGSQTFEPNSR